MCIARFVEDAGAEGETGKRSALTVVSNASETVSLEYWKCGVFNTEQSVQKLTPQFSR